MDAEKTAPVSLWQLLIILINCLQNYLEKADLTKSFLWIFQVRKKREYFSIHLQKNRQNVSSFALDILAQKAEGFNGAEIEECVKEAMFTAYVESQESNIAPKLQMIHILDAIKNTVPPF